MMGVGQSSAEWSFLYLFIADVQQLSGSQAERLFSFIVQLGPAEWPSPFSTVQCLTFKGGRVVSRMAISFLFNVQRSMSVRQSSQAEWSSLLLSNVDAESVFFVVFVVLLGRYLCCIVMFMFIYYLLTYLVSLNLQKRQQKKRKVGYKCSLPFYFAFWYGMRNLALFLSIHVLNFAL